MIKLVEGLPGELIESGDDNSDGSGESLGDSAAQTRRRAIREAIVRAAHASLVEVGFEHITTRRIAESAGVNIATLHYYFGSKEALLAEAVGTEIAASEQRLRAAVESAPDAANALRAGTARVWELVRERPGRLRFDLAVRGFRNDEARRSAIANGRVFENLMGEIFERHLAEGGSLRLGLTPQTLATHLFSVMDGVVLRFALTRDEAAALLSLSLILNEALTLMGIENEQIANEFNGF
jgi:AcrR family transcriptional regulator